MRFMTCGHASSCSRCFAALLRGTAQVSQT
jgi:hypothetical protein